MRKTGERAAGERARQVALAHALRKSSIDLLISTLVHELSQPMTAINAWASTCLRLVESGPESRDRAIEGLKLLERESRRATEDLRRFRESWYRGEAEETAVDLNEILAETAAALRDEADTLGVAISLDLGDVPAICADRELMALVVFILCRNGLDAIRDAPKEGKRITVRSCAAGPAARVEIADTGPGVDDDAAALLFTPVRSRKRDGLGIGLAISRSIIRSLGGRMWLASNSCEGATFAFEVPGVQGMPGGGAQGGTAEGVG